MKMSCNGCRVLRKGCSEDCCLRPCLQWITSADSQANATVFLAKFYGRPGLINLINAGPANLRPLTFRSLLYEACGRVVNPIYGSAGLMWSGDWQRCQEAVDAVLAGTPIMQMTDDDAAVEGHPIMPLKGGDIRHLSKDSTGIHRVKNNRNRLKQFGSRNKKADNYAAQFLNEAPINFSITGWNDNQNHELNQTPSHDSISDETVEPALMNLVHEAGPVVKSETRMDVDDDELLLDLTLGLRPVQQLHSQLSAVAEIASDGDV